MSTESAFDVIAERVLEARAEGRPSATVTVRIGRPEPDPEPGGAWRAAVEIEGLSDGGTMYVYGEDSAQALLLALQIAGARLRYTADEVALTWFGGDDLGFPLPAPSIAEGE